MTVIVYCKGDSDMLLEKISLILQFEIIISWKALDIANRLA
jgi:hypothetical protein